MLKPTGTFRNLIIWTYERGTLQYDIICALILAFIFFVPRGCFVSKRAEGTKPSMQKAHAVPPSAYLNDDRQK